MRVVIGAGATSLLLTGLIGLLHLPAAAPLLRAISPASLCPIRHGTPQQIDRGHDLGAAAIRSSASSAAPARPALGFALDGTRRGDLDAWAASHKVSCASIGGNDTLRKCTAVPAAAVGQPDELGALEEVSFELRSSGELVSVETLRRRLEPARAAEVAAALEARAARDVGAPSKVGGEATAAHLGHGPLSSYVAEHHFTDYAATISATNLAPTGVMVRERYVSTRP
jgi:hypothetical protein